jgi:hypothetical protein
VSHFPRRSSHAHADAVQFSSSGHPTPPATFLAPTAGWPGGFWSKEGVFVQGDALVELVPNPGTLTLSDHGDHAMANQLGATSSPSGSRSSLALEPKRQDSTTIALPAAHSAQDADAGERRLDPVVQSGSRGAKGASLANVEAVVQKVSYPMSTHSRHVLI